MRHVAGRYYSINDEYINSLLKTYELFSQELYQIEKIRLDKLLLSHANSFCHFYGKTHKKFPFLTSLVFSVDEPPSPIRISETCQARKLRRLTKASVAYADVFSPVVPPATCIAMPPLIPRF